jgi:hypothetical protein
MARRGWVVEKGREFGVIVDEVGLDILKAVRKIEARASIGLAGRRARRCTKDVGRVLRIRNPSFETATSGRRLTLRHWPLWRASEAYLQLVGFPKHGRECSGHFIFRVNVPKSGHGVALPPGRTVYPLLSPLTLPLFYLPSFSPNSLAPFAFPLATIADRSPSSCTTAAQRIRAVTSLFLSPHRCLSNRSIRL